MPPKQDNYNAAFGCFMGFFIIGEIIQGIALAIILFFIVQFTGC